jgi:hypothetical protein
MGRGQQIALTMCTNPNKYTELTGASAIQPISGSGVTIFGSARDEAHAAATHLELSQTADRNSAEPHRSQTPPRATLHRGANIYGTVHTADPPFAA